MSHGGVARGIRKMTSLEIYFDTFSQPSRAVLLLLAANKIKYKPYLIKIAKGESRTREDFLKVSASRTVPAMDDNGFRVFESVAIMKYLVSKYNLPDHWYPSDIKQRAKIDEYLHWHGGNLRIGAAWYIFNKYIAPRMLGSEPNADTLEVYQTVLQSSLKMLERHFLKETKFINSDVISIADLHAACELTQFWLTEEDVLADRPRISQWLSDVQSVLSPHFDEVHKMVYLAKKKRSFISKL